MPGDSAITIADRIVRTASAEAAAVLRRAVANDPTAGTRAVETARAAIVAIVSDARTAAYLAGADAVARKASEKTLGGKTLARITPAGLPGLPGGSLGTALRRFPLVSAAISRLQARGLIDWGGVSAVHDTNEAYAAEETPLPSVTEGWKVFSRIGGLIRHAVQESYADGFRSITDQPSVQEQFPYRRYRTMRDDRVRTRHRALEKLGIAKTAIYRSDDPFWDLFTPPWDYGCRCGFEPLTIAEAASAGLREAERWLNTGIKPPLRPRNIPFTAPLFPK